MDPACFNNCVNGIAIFQGNYAHFIMSKLVEGISIENLVLAAPTDDLALTVPTEDFTSTACGSAVQELQCGSVVYGNAFFVWTPFCG